MKIFIGTAKYDGQVFEDLIVVADDWEEVVQEIREGLHQQYMFLMEQIAVQVKSVKCLGIYSKAFVANEVIYETENWR